MRRAVRLVLLISAFQFFSLSAFSKDQTFSYTNAQATSVRLMGEFNAWQGVAMTNSGGTWTVTIPLAPGTYAYKLLVDTNWILDPNNSNTRTVNGVTNSSITITDVQPAVPVTGSAPAVNCALSKSFYIDPLTANTTVTFTNFADGDTIILRVRQATSGGPFTISFPGVSASHWQGHSQPVQTTSAGASDFYSLHNQGGTLYANASQNY